ncbi:hypothetical protein M8J76_005307 [Diaphorina citri]|nr:hypothetical protein M8J76_005307 [Diaphorina citri]
MDSKEMDKYEVLGRIGQGAHGHVLRARNKSTNQIVAIKRILIRRRHTSSVKTDVMREIKTLLSVTDRYIVKLLDFFPDQDTVCLVFEHMDSGLWELLHDKKIHLTIPHVKTYMQMLLKGVSYLHGKFIMHRDLKPANLLIDKAGILKIADFGLARSFDVERWGQYTPEVASRWYRAPELLYASRCYDQSVDLWAVGCILGEMYTNAPLFPGESDIEQLAMVLHKLGTPTEDSWPGLKDLPDYNKITFAPSDPVPWSTMLPNASPDTLDLISKLLLYDGQKRLPANEALLHKYFFTHPLPCIERDLPKPETNHRELLKQEDGGNIFLSLRI